jgi:hypothetical protein
MNKAYVFATALSAALLLGSFADVPEASAQAQCVRNCKSEVKLCGKGVREAFKGCRESCKRTQGGKACILECKDVMSTARSDCKERLPACAQSCLSDAEFGSGSSSGELDCGGTCKQNFRECLGEGAEFARLCGRQCIVDRKDDFAACATSPNPLACYLYAGLSAARCLIDCGSQIREWPGMCRMELDQCLTDCEGPPPPPYGSASNAFVAACSNLLH